MPADAVDDHCDQVARVLSNSRDFSQVFSAIFSRFIDGLRSHFPYITTFACAGDQMASLQIGSLEERVENQQERADRAH
jgi:hypothetical protein